MKKLTLTTLFLVLAYIAIAQSPFFFNYQAVARNAQNQILKNQSISLKISILKGSNTGISVFEEKHDITSSGLGVVNLQIGNGQNQTGSLSGINWKNNSLWLKVEMDDTGGTNYSLMSTSQLISVPFALHAETATNVDDADANPQNELQNLLFNSTTNELTISNGNSVTIPTGGTDADADPLNEIQTISKNGNTVTLSKNGGSFTDDIDDADANPSNEIQNLELNGNTLSISQSNHIDLSSFESLWKTDGIGIKYEGTRIRIFDPVNLNEQVTINPYVVNVNTNNDFQSYLRGNRLEFQNLSITPNLKAEYGFGGLKFSKLGSQPIKYTVFDKDSLWQFDPGIGLLLPSTTKMLPGHLTLDFGSFETTRLSGFGLDISSKDVRDLSLDVNTGLQLFEYVSPSDRFTRFSLGPDSLNMYNSAKWKIAQFGKDPDFNNGMLKLFHSGGLGELAHISGYDDGGGFLHFVANGEIKAELDASLYGSRLTLFGMNNSLQYFAATNDMQGGGYMAISDTLSSPQVQIWATRDSVDFLIWGEDPVQSTGHIYSSGDIYSPIVQSVIKDTVWSEMNNLGFVTEGEFAINTARSLKSENWVIWEPSLSMRTGQFKEGNAIFNGTNGNLNTAIFGNIGSDGANYGAIRVFDNLGNARAGIEVDPTTGDGTIWATTKNFRIDHPTNPNKDIVYASLEGPEAAAYVRGTSKLINGEAFVQFPDYYKYIANPETMTIILTPLHWDTYGVAAIEKSENGFMVKELKGEKGNFEFDWEVKCVRKGHEDFQVIRDKVTTNLNVNKETRKKTNYSPRPNLEMSLKKNKK